MDPNRRIRARHSQSYTEVIDPVLVYVVHVELEFFLEVLFHQLLKFYYCYLLIVNCDCRC
jgi:hypothetical protein